MKWEKLGLVYCPKGEQTWMQSHAYVPTPLQISPEVIRVYAAFWDSNKVGRVGYVDVAAQNPKKVLAVSQEPVLDIGGAGEFDADGVSVSQVLPIGDQLIMYYFGWQTGTDVRYRIFSGAAISTDRGNSFIRHSPKPVLPPCPGEGVVRSAMTVKPEGDHYRSWYVSGNEWIDIAGKKVPSYGLYTLISPDGFSWPGAGEVCIRPSLANNEFGLGRPWVDGSNGKLILWFSVRSRPANYRIGRAIWQPESGWQRTTDMGGIEPSNRGWDSEMICFPAITRTAGNTYLFYNGNNYGETGFGVAVLRE